MEVEGEQIIDLEERKQQRELLVSNYSSIGKAEYMNVPPIASFQQRSQQNQKEKEYEKQRKCLFGRELNKKGSERALWKIRFQNDLNEFIGKLSPQNSFPGCSVTIREVCKQESMIILRICFSVNQGVFSGKIITMKLLVSTEFPFAPVEIFAEESIMHPNVDVRTKQVYLPMLDGMNWLPTFTIQKIVTELTVILLNPSLGFIPNNPLNIYCAELFGCSQKEFESTLHSIDKVLNQSNRLLDENGNGEPTKDNQLEIALHSLISRNQLNEHLRIVEELKLKEEQQYEAQLLINDACSSSYSPRFLYKKPRREQLKITCSGSYGLNSNEANEEALTPTLIGNKIEMELDEECSTKLHQFDTVSCAIHRKKRSIRQVHSINPTSYYI